MDEHTISLKQMYSPDGSLLRQDQLALLEIAKEFDTICKSNGLQWWLSSGTLLGCIRHDGFIPWDDDIDVVMTKEDYKKLIEIMSEYKSDKFVFQSKENDFNYLCMYGKFRSLEGEVTTKNPQVKYYKWRGIGIDVFSIEHSSYFNAYMSSKTYALMMKFMRIDNSHIRKLVTKSLQFFCFDILFPLYKCFDVFAKAGENHYIQGSGWANHTFCDEDIYPLGKHVFEDVEFPVPANFDSYLKRVFGDYMKIPNRDTILKNIHCEKYLREISSRIQKNEQD